MRAHYTTDELAACALADQLHDLLAEGGDMVSIPAAICAKVCDVLGGLVEDGERTRGQLDWAVWALGERERKVRIQVQANIRAERV